MINLQYSELRAANSRQFYETPQGLWSTWTVFITAWKALAAVDMSHAHLFYLIFSVDRLSVAVVCGCCSWNPSDKKVIHRVLENNKKSTLEGLISVIKILKKSSVFRMGTVWSFRRSSLWINYSFVKSFRVDYLDLDYFNITFTKKLCEFRSCFLKRNF